MTSPVTAPEHDGTGRTRSLDARVPARSPLWRDAWALGGLAAAVRLVVAAVAVRSPRGLHDPLLYQSFARGLADGSGYVGLLGRPTAYYPPGYPLFLGVVQRAADAVGLGAHLPATAAVVQAALGGVAAGAVVVAGHRLVPPTARGPRPRRVAVAAGLVVALWPNFVLYGSLLLSETLFVALFAVFVAAVLTVGDLRRPRPVPLVVAGLSFGAAALVRPQVLLGLPALAVAWALARIGWRRTLLGVGVLVAGAVVVIVPWTVRNAVVMGHLVPISTNTGDNLCIGFHDGATARYDYGPDCETDGSYVDGPDVEVRRDAENRRRALHWITSNPGALPLLGVRKIWYTFDSDRDGLAALESYGDDRVLAGGARSALGVLFDATYALILLGAATGTGVLLGRGTRRSVGPLVLLALTAAGLVVPALFFGDPRFKVALVPCLALLAGIGVDAGARALRRRRGGDGAADRTGAPGPSGARDDPTASPRQDVTEAGRG